MSNSNITQGMSHVDTNSEGKPYHEHSDKKAQKEDHPRTHSEKHYARLPDEKEFVSHHSYDNQNVKGSGQEHK